ncbi:hypothetical protein [Flavobacterium humi]|nr:hypothetical protein [Flavobacterium humi]
MPFPSGLEPQLLFADFELIKQNYEFPKSLLATLGSRSKIMLRWIPV